MEPFPSLSTLSNSARSSFSSCSPSGAPISALTPSLTAEITASWASSNSHLRPVPRLSARCFSTIALIISKNLSPASASSWALSLSLMRLMCITTRAASLKRILALSTRSLTFRAAMSPAKTARISTSSSLLRFHLARSILARGTWAPMKLPRMEAPKFKFPDSPVLDLSANPSISIVGQLCCIAPRAFSTSLTLHLRPLAGTAALGPPPVWSTSSTSSICSMSSPLRCSSVTYGETYGWELAA
mmetsp:Transcript_31992/g.81430  ORF Transcript_31992/g.81430 Transcript_31992/m.81430 type:complete len:244 (+) Transcript_31992:79-810(+)